MTPDVVSAREAAELLAPRSRSTVQRWLAAGLAGEPLRTRRSALFDRARVEALRDMNIEVGCRGLPSACEDGIFVVRWDPGTSLEEVATAAERARAAAEGPWFMGGQSRDLLEEVAQGHGFVPLIVTAASACVVGAEIVGWTRVDDAGTRPHRGMMGRAGRGRVAWLQVVPTLRDAGEWWPPFVGERLDMGRGNPWELWASPRLNPRVRAARERAENLRRVRAGAG
jgi:hypothetical protein